MLSVVDDARVLAGDGNAAWSESFNELFAQVAGVFGNAAVRRHGRAYVLGLLSQAERKNGWTLAEFAGDVSPDGMQRLLNFSPWDEDACRDAVRRYVVRHLGDPGAVLVVDETGFLKMGKMSAGVARMYTGTAGRVENCQVGVFLAYAAPDGSRALIDRELYLPEKWTSDRDRCRAAGIGDDVAFATKPELAEKMIARAAEARVPFAWVARGRGLRREPGAAVLAGRRGHRLRDGRRVQRGGHCPGGTVPCGRAGGTRASPRLAAAQLRRRVEGAAAV
jgi:SRSO17 transposase